jgi:hypothetical protein
MADLPITSDEGGQPVVITDAVTTGNTLNIEADGSITTGDVRALDVENNKGFSVIAEVLPATTAETPVFLIKNPNASGVTLKVLQFLMGILASVGSATGNNAIFRLYLDPTITTNGTALTISSLYSKTGASTSVLTAFSSPTIAANGTKLGAYTIASQEGTLFIPQNLTRLLGPNHSWLITQTSTVNGTATGVIQLEWVEE